MSLKIELRNYCATLGLESVGFSQCRIYHELSPYFHYRKNAKLENEFEEKEIEKRVNPFIWMPEGKTILSIAFPYLHSPRFNAPIHFSKYTLGKDYHLVVAMYLQKICEYIEQLGGKAKFFVDSNALPERYLASLSGIGFIGKNNMLITPKYGSYVFLGEIITDLYIEPDLPMESQCGQCNHCISACPTGALVEEKEKKDGNICLSYITQKKDVEEHWFKEFKGRLFGCDTCQRVCPYNQKASLSLIEEFTPLAYMEEPDLLDLIQLDNQQYKQKYKGLSCGWRGKNILIRNALINAVALGKIDIETFKLETASPYIKDYYHRLFHTFKL